MNILTTSTRSTCRPESRERGQTLVEFALVLPILALLLFGVIQFGIVFHQYVTLTDAVRAGARQGAVGRHLASPQTAVEDRVRSSAGDLDQAKLGVSVSSSWQQGSDVSVSATYPYSINLLGFVIKSGDLKSTTTERVE
ncbi:MAG TPA: TadE family protein [Gaiellaceae bacterium]|nr:TadE family protein [Gaiellaceae bacterium]